MLGNCYNTLASSMASIHLQHTRGETLGVEVLPGTLVMEPKSDETILSLIQGERPGPILLVSLAFSKRPGVRCTAAESVHPCVDES